MLKIKFEYCDDWTFGSWRNQQCIMESVEECKEIYGLGKDCYYHILSVEEIQ